MELNGAELTPSIWQYSVHSDNPELIRHLEEIKITPKNKSYGKIFNKLIKCHHNEIANYIMNNFLQDNKNTNDLFFRKYLKYYNFSYLENDKLNKNLFIQLCQYDYVPFVTELMKCNDININEYSKTSDDDYERKTALLFAIDICFQMPK